MRNVWTTYVWTTLAILIAIAPAVVRAGGVQFSRDIQPILADNCYACHGPDKENRQANLRLDLREQALADRDGSPAIVPSHPEKSELVRRIFSSDPDERMPPPKSQHQLTAAQKNALKQWIAEGAIWTKHWSLIKPERPAIPQVKESAWVRNPIDAFVLARLEQEGLRHASEADKATLIRRVTLDLTGLLPTPQETAAFVADTSTNAYEKLVDRLLASDAYGEHRARYWLDYARYGDTQGLHVDAYQSRWPYRDYVIRAFNTDMPFDQFTREQLAGDLLPPERVDQLTATGFIRCGIATGEGGSIIEELRCNVKRERAEAYGSVFMGMTVGCAVCHDHKYDPITQKDFYSLTAFFNNLAEKPSTDDRADWAPSIRVPKSEHRAEYDAVMAKKAAVLRKIAARRAKSQKLIADWRAKGGRPKPVSPDKLALRLRLDENYPEGSEGSTLLHNSAPSASPATFTAEGPKPHWGEETWLWPSFRLETNTRVNLGTTGDFEKDQPFSCGGWTKVRNVPANNTFNTQAGALLARLDVADKFRGWNLYYSSGTVIAQLIHAWPDSISVKTEGNTEHRSPFMPPQHSAEGVNLNASAPRGEWEHIFFTYDGSGKAAGVKIYVNGSLQKMKVEHDQLTGTIRTKAPTWLGRRHDAEPMQATAYQDWRLYGRALAAEEVARLPREDVAAEIFGRTKPADWSAGMSDD